MRKTASFLRYQIGPVFGGIIDLPPERDASGTWTWHCVLVTNNGQVWSAEKIEGPAQFVWNMARQRGGTPGEKYTLYKIGSLAKEQPQWRLPIEWARKEAKEVGRVYSTPAAQLLTPDTLARAQGSGNVVYVGFEAIKSQSAHSLQDLHEILDTAIATCTSAWAWDAGTVQVCFHNDDKVFGLAYECGKGSLTGTRVISLNVRLLASYDAKSVSRTVLHELCHHFREEKWPRGSARGPWNESHDKKFCDSLKMVDPLAADPTGCAFFTEMRDASIVAAREEKLAAEGKAPIWDPAIGCIVYDSYASGKLRLQYRPREGVKVKWAKQVSFVTTTTVVELARHFAPEQWGAVEVITPKWRGATEAPKSLRGLLEHMVKLYRSLAGPINEYAKSVGVNLTEPAST